RPSAATAAAGDRLLRGGSFAASLLPPRGVAGVDLRVGWHLPPVLAAADREAGRGHGPRDSNAARVPVDRERDAARPRRLPQGLPRPAPGAAGAVWVSRRPPAGPPRDSP